MRLFKNDDYSYSTYSLVAEQVSDNVIALVFWERFFLLVFEVIAFYGDLDYFPVHVKKSLNDYFNKVGQQLMILNLNAASQAYFSFTTWDKNIILYILSIF